MVLAHDLVMHCGAEACGCGRVCLVFFVCPYVYVRMRVCVCVCVCVCFVNYAGADIITRAGAEYFDSQTPGPFGDSWHTREGTSAGNPDGPW